MNKTTLTKQNAELIYELLTNAGWMDDADELLADLVDNEGVEVAEQKMKEVNDLISLINPLLDQPLTLIDEDLESYWLTCPNETSTLLSVMKKVQITLELNEKIVKKIEKLTGDKFKDLIEKEINESGEVFIEMMGYDNIWVSVVYIESL